MLAWVERLAETVNAKPDLDQIGKMKLGDFIRPLLEVLADKQRRLDKEICHSLQSGLPGLSNQLFAGKNGFVCAG